MYQPLSQRFCLGQCSNIISRIATQIHSNFLKHSEIPHYPVNAEGISGSKLCGSVAVTQAWGRWTGLLAYGGAPKSCCGKPGEPQLLPWVAGHRMAGPQSGSSPHSAAHSPAVPRTPPGCSPPWGRRSQGRAARLRAALRRTTHGPREPQHLAVRWPDAPAVETRKRRPDWGGEDQACPPQSRLVLDTPDRAGVSDGDRGWATAPVRPSLPVPAGPGRGRVTVRGMVCSSGSATWMRPVEVVVCRNRPCRRTHRLPFPEGTRVKTEKLF